MLKVILYISLFILIISALAAYFVFKEFGASPSAQEEQAFEKLSYYQDGQFQSPIKLKYDFDNVRNGPAGFVRFLRQSIFAPQGKLPKVALDKNSFAQTPADFALFWLGHSSAIIEIEGKRLIFDPVLGNAAPIPYAVPRYDKAPIERDNLPSVDYIIITHNHYDHLERKTVQSIKTGQFIVPLGLGAALQSWGIEKDRITELGWGETFEQDGLKIIAEEGVHYSNRSPWNRNKTLWNSYIISSPKTKIFWGGDTGYGPHFARIGQDHGPFDMAALEIDGWNTGWVNTHMFPQETIQAAQDLRAKSMLPIHWAVFDLALHPWHESIDMVLEEAKGKPLNILTPQMGEKINLTSPTSHWWKNIGSTYTR